MSTFSPKLAKEVLNGLTDWAEAFADFTAWEINGLDIDNLTDEDLPALDKLVVEVMDNVQGLQDHLRPFLHHIFANNPERTDPAAELALPSKKLILPN